MTAIQEDEIFGEPEPVMSAAERREMEILNVHPFIAKRRVKTISSDYTRKESWYGSASYHKGKIGETGTVVEVHSSITEAVKVKLDGRDSSDYRYWHFKDLEMFEDKPIVVDPVMFDPMNLVV